MIVSEPWIEALVAVNEDIVICERRFHRQCAHVVAAAAVGQVTPEDELLLASYGTSLILLRAFRDSLLEEAPHDP